MALLQSLVGVNQDHGRMITGMPSTHLSRCLSTANHMPTPGQRTEPAGHMTAHIQRHFP
jgi:hypothetical protein